MAKKGTKGTADTDKFLVAEKALGMAAAAWEACGSPTCALSGPEAALAAESGLAMDHREMSLSHPAVRVLVGLGSGIAAPDGRGKLWWVDASEWVVDAGGVGRLSLPDRPREGVRSLLVRACYMDGGESASLAFGVFLDGGTLADCVRRNRDASTAAAYMALVGLVVAAETI